MIINTRFPGINETIRNQVGINHDFDAMSMLQNVTELENRLINLSKDLEKMAKSA